jgi:hypothetical protein
MLCKQDHRKRVRQKQVSERVCSMLRSVDQLRHDADDVARVALEQRVDARVVGEAHIDQLWGRVRPIHAQCDSYAPDDAVTRTSD